jgi:hypothetical protein
MIHNLKIIEFDYLIGSDLDSKIDEIMQEEINQDRSVRIINIIEHRKENSFGHIYYHIKLAIEIS